MGIHCYWKNEIFRDFLHTLDASFVAMGRIILLFVDNCGTLSPDTSSLLNITAIPLPKLHLRHIASLVGCGQVLQGNAVQSAAHLMDTRKRDHLKIDFLCAICLFCDGNK
jgi:hypothetical protein